MTIRIPNGSLFHMGTVYGATKAMSAVSNADPGVATLEASHGVSTGDIIEVLTSGWSRLDGKVIKAGTVSVNDVPLTGVNTTSTSIYAAGSGVGTIREVSTWTQITQILDSNSNGGEQQFYEYQTLEADAQRRIPTVKTAYGLTLTVGDDVSLAGYTALENANDDRLQRATRVTFPDGSKLYFSALWTLNKMPSLTVNTAMALQVTLSLLNEPMRYTS